MRVQKGSRRMQTGQVAVWYTERGLESSAVCECTAELRTWTCRAEISEQLSNTNRDSLNRNISRCINVVTISFYALPLR